MDREWFGSLMEDLKERRVSASEEEAEQRMKMCSVTVRKSGNVQVAAIGGSSERLKGAVFESLTWKYISAESTLLYFASKVLIFGSKPTKKKKEEEEKEGLGVGEGVTRRRTNDAVDGSCVKSCNRVLLSKSAKNQERRKRLQKKKLCIKSYGL